MTPKPRGPLLALFLLPFATVCISCAEPPKGEAYRKVDVSGPQGKHVPFICETGRHSWTTYEQSSPWQLELDLDTMHECICGTHCLIRKTSADSDTLWVRGYDRDSLCLDRFITSPAETMHFHMRSWNCYGPP